VGFIFQELNSTEFTRKLVHESLSPRGENGSRDTHTHTHTVLSLPCISVTGSESFTGMLAVVRAPDYTQREREREGEGEREGGAEAEADPHTQFPEPHTLSRSQTATLWRAQDDMPQRWRQSLGTLSARVGPTAD